jgi:hypothetical protein
MKLRRKMAQITCVFMAFDPLFLEKASVSLCVFLPLRRWRVDRCGGPELPGRCLPTRLAR